MTRLLEDISALQSELRKKEFDHAAIAQLKDRLAGYARVVDVRGKHTTASGVDEWVGWVELLREEVNEVAIDNTARVISDVDADVICLVEIESRPALKVFHDKILCENFLKPKNQAPYRWIMVIEGNDERGIDVAIMSRNPIEWVRSHADDTVQYMGRTVALFSRDCLEAHIDLGAGKRLHVLANHLKSMRPSEGDPLSNMRRQQQAAAVADLVKAHDLTSELVVVAGDLNSDPTSPSMVPILSVIGLHNVNEKLPDGQRGTYRTGKQQLDYLLVSEPLWQALKDVSIERRGVYTKTKWIPYPTVTSNKTSASDHSSVVANFEVA